MNPAVFILQFRKSGSLSDIITNNNCSNDKNFGESSCIPVWGVIQNYHRVYFVLEHHSLIHRKRSETVKREII